MIGLAGDVEADRDHRRRADAAEGAKDDARRLRIVPDVEFGRRRDVARLGIGAAHDDEPLDEARQLGFAHQRERDIGQRPGRAEDEAPGMRARGGDDGVDSVTRAGLLLGLGQDRMAEAGLAVDLARVPDRDRQRGRRARPDGNVGAPGKRENRPRVARRGGEGDVADDRGDAEDLRLFVRAGVEQRQRVVDAGVDVDDEGLGAARTWRQSPVRLMSPLSIAVKCGGILWPGARPGVKRENRAAPC